LAYYFWWENKLATGNWRQAIEKQSGRKVEFSGAWRVFSGEKTNNKVFATRHIDTNHYLKKELTACCGLYVLQIFALYGYIINLAQILYPLP
jgi:hypothetical protein